MSTRREREERKGTGRKTWSDRMDDLRRQNRRERDLTADDLRQREQARIDKLNREFMEKQRKAHQADQVRRVNEIRRQENERERQRNLDAMRRHQEEMRRRYGR